MTEKEIREGNILIAEFLGSKYIDDAPEDYPNGYYYQPEDLEEDCPTGDPEEWVFNSSWDWLMPVVEKIERIENPIIHVEIATSHVRCKCSKWLLEYLEDGYDEEDSKIGAVYKMILAFIKEYNEQNK